MLLVSVPRTCLSCVQHFRKRVGREKKTPSRTSSSAVTAAAAAAAEASSRSTSKQRQQQQQQAAAAAATAEAEATEGAESTSEHLRTPQQLRALHSSIYFGLIFQDENTAPSSSDLRHIPGGDYRTHVQQSYSYHLPQLRYLPLTLPVPPPVERA